jgi:hypothetical protein
MCGWRRTVWWIIEDLEEGEVQKRAREVFEDSDLKDVFRNAILGSYKIKPLSLSSPHLLLSPTPLPTPHSSPSLRQICTVDPTQLQFRVDKTNLAARKIRFIYSISSFGELTDDDFY